MCTRRRPMSERLLRIWAGVSLHTRLVLLLMAGLMSVQTGSLWWALSERATAARRTALVQQVQRAADVVAVIDAVPVQDRAGVAAAIPYPIVRLDAAPADESTMPEVAAAVREVWERRLSGREISVVATRSTFQRAGVKESRGRR